MISLVTLLIFLTSLCAIINSIIGVSLNLFTPEHAFIYSFCGFITLFALDALLAFIGHKLPKSLIRPTKKIFRVSKKEKLFLEKIGIKKWKDKIPETGELAGFKKDKMESTNLDYIYKFLEETVYAEIIHFMMGFSGVLLIPFILLPVVNGTDLLCFLLPLSIVNLFFNLPSLIIQRYTRYKLLNYYNYKLNH